MTALTWTTLQTALLAALSKAQPPYNVVPADFAALYPSATSYAESRICQDIPMLANRTQDTSLATVAGTRTLTTSGMALTLLAPEGVALLTPAGSTLATGTLEPFDMSSLDVIDMVWPTQSLTLAPSAADWIGRRWAMRDDHTIVLCPTPDAAYTVVVTGLFAPTPISSSNPSTYLATVYPDLLTAACMVWLCGALLKNFSAQGDLPQQAISWEAQYGTLKAAAEHEEMRRRGLTPNVAKPAAPGAPPQ
jgi:hypothetical protein